MSSLFGSIKFSVENDANDYTEFKLENKATGKFKNFHQSKSMGGFSPQTLIEAIKNISQYDECVEAPVEDPADSFDTAIEEPSYTRQKANAYVRAKQIVDDRYRALIEADKVNTKFKAYAEMDDNTLEHVVALLYAKEILEEAYGEEETDE